MPEQQPPILVFRSARPGASFEAWLFRKLPPATRCAVTAAIAVMLPRDARSAGDSDRCRRRGPGLCELRLPVRRPASRPRSGSPGRPNGPLLDIGVFFTWANHAPVILHGDATVTTGFPPRHGTPGLGGARRRLRELREAERQGVLRHRLVLGIFDDTKYQSRRALPLRETHDPLGALVDFEQIETLIHIEAAAAGPHMLIALAEAEERCRIGEALRTRRIAAGLTQRLLASHSGIPHYSVSEIENGCANPTLSTLGALARALGAALTVSEEGTVE